MNCEKGCNCVHKATGTEQTLDELDWKEEFGVERQMEISTN